MSAHNATNGQNDHGVRYIPLHYNNADSDASATQLVVALFPEWEQGEGKIEFTTFKDGITNTVRRASPLVAWSRQESRSLITKSSS